MLKFLIWLVLFLLFIRNLEPWVEFRFSTSSPISASPSFLKLAYGQIQNIHN